MRMIWPSVALLAFVTLQRLVELPIARANTKRLLAEGGHEVGASHYPIIVALHAAWLVTLWWLAPDRPIDIPFLLLFLLIEAGRVWVLRTLGNRWTTRIIVMPGEKLIEAGPYRFVRHPNYLVVIGEIAVLPLVFGLWDVAIIFSLLNAAMLTVRIRTENRALGR
jgi:methyltransferase